MWPKKKKEENTRILNIGGQSNPGEAFTEEDLHIDEALADLLLTKSPRMGGHSGKRPTPEKLFAWVTNKEYSKTWLLSLEKHIQLFTALVYWQGSSVGYVGKLIERKHYGTIKHLTTSVDVEWLWKGLLTPLLCSKLTSEADAGVLGVNDPMLEWRTKWKEMIFSTLSTVKTELNSLDGER
jgi:hypothetical protein